MDKPPPGYVRVADALQPEFPASRRARPARVTAKWRGVPRRDTKTGRVYYFLIENRDKQTDLVDVSTLYKAMSRLTVRRKIWVLREKHGMRIDKPEDAPDHVYKVEPIAGRAPDGLRASDRLVKTVLTRQAKAFGALYAEDGEANLDAWVEDTFLMLTNELRWGAK